MSGVGGGAVGEDVAPDGHDGVADEFIERAVEAEHVVHHFAEVFIKLEDELGFVGFFGESGEVADVGEEDGDGASDTAEGIHERLRIVEKHLDEVLGHVTFEGFPDASPFDPFAEEVVDEGGEAAEVQHQQRGDNEVDEIGGVVEPLAEEDIGDGEEGDGDDPTNRGWHEDAEERGEEAGDCDGDGSSGARWFGEELGVESCTDDVEMDLGTEHLFLREIERGGVIVMEEVGGGSDDDDLSAEELAVLIVVFPEVGREDVVKWLRGVALPWWAGVTEPDMLVGWGEVRVSEMVERASGEGSVGLGVLLVNIALSELPEEKRVGELIVGSSDDAVGIGPDVDVADSWIVGSRHSVFWLEYGSVGKHLRDGAAAGVGIAEVASDDHFVPVFFESCGEGFVAGARGEEEKIDYDDAGAGVGQSFDCMSPDFAGPGKVLTESLESGGLLCFLVEFEGDVAVGGLIDADEGESGVHGGGASDPRSEILGIGFELEQRSEPREVQCEGDGCPYRADPAKDQGSFARGFQHVDPDVTGLTGGAIDFCGGVMFRPLPFEQIERRCPLKGAFLRRPGRGPLHRWKQEVRRVGLMRSVQV